MNRLTYKEKWRDEFGNEHLYDSEDNYCIEKLGQLEDLEEELGIDLITLFKALKSGVWYREWKEPIKHTCGLRLLKSGKSCWGLDNKNYYFPLEEYSKTWSLRKEDLEDDK